MTLTPSTIKPSAGAKRGSKRVGRGDGSGRGTYSTRGLKGQRARSGGKKGLLKHAFKPQLQKVPKLRGFNSLNARARTITLAQLEKVGKEGEILTPSTLKKAGIVNKMENEIKIVATGELKKKLEIQGCLASKKAVEQIEKAGGKLVY